MSLHFVKRAALIGLVCLLWGSCLTAQKLLSQPTVTFSPLSLFELTAGPTAGFDVVLYKKLVFSADAQWIFYWASRSSNGDNNIRGYRVRPALRIYLQKNKDVNEGIYLQAGYLFKKTRQTIYRDLFINDPNGNYQYTYSGGYTRQKLVDDISIKFGGRLFFDASKHAGIDLYCGLGLRKRTVTHYGYPSGASNEPQNFDIDNTLLSPTSNGFQIPSFPLGLTFFYKF